MNGNILIVDDETGTLKLLKDILSAEGYAVRPFNNGELALRSLAAEAPELILLDIHMPGMDGFEVCQRIKENGRLNEIPVIFISAAAEVEDKVKAFQAGGVDYITKPFQKEEVLSRVKTHVALYRTMQEIKRIGDALRNSEESLKMAQAIARLGHWEWDVQTGQFDWSEELFRIFGLEPHEYPESFNALLQMVHPEDRERVASHLSLALDGGEFDIEFRIVLPDGRVRMMQGKGKAIYLSSNGSRKIIGTIQEAPEHRQVKMLGVVQDITERKEMERQLELQANTDVLTGCASRRHFLEQAQQEFARVHRYGGAMSLLMLDLDHFKQVNDQYGHHAGDLTLRKLVEVCAAILRDVDVTGRLGGEEFAIMLPETGIEQALEVAERLRQAVATTEVPLNGGAPLHFTTSVGVATLTEADSSIDQMISRADLALYKAKHAGRDRVCA